MLALLALALFPVLAHAETSAGATYTPEVPSVETKETTPKTHTEKSPATHHKSSNNAQAEGSVAGNGGSESSVGPEEEAESEESQKSSGVAGNGGNSNPPRGGSGEGGGSPKAGGTANSADGISGAKAVANKNPGANVSEGSGGSSPVVPILIAVVVLAAISIGVVLYRQRKSGQGPDPRVSSPNAS
jgi:cobalamin biosynthesis Mg chelatase CobN